MRVIIAGGRWEDIHQEGKDFIVSLVKSGGITSLVCGMATGIDIQAYHLLKPLIPVDKYPALWEDLSVEKCLIKTNKRGHKYNALAGHNRNELMAQNADAIILFPGGTGTDNMRKLAKRYKLKIIKDYGEILF